MRQAGTGGQAGGGGGGGGGGGSPTGPAGGDLQGTYPNPTVDPTIFANGRAFSGYRSTTDPITTAFNTLAMESEMVPSDPALYSWSSGNPVTVQEDGDYLFTGKLTADRSAGGGTRRVVFGGFVNGALIDGTDSISDLEGGGFTPANHMSFAVVVPLSAGDTVEVAAVRLSGGGTVTTLLDTVALTLVQLRKA